MIEYKSSLLFWWVISSVLMLLWDIQGDKVIDFGYSWAFLFLLVGIIVLNVKLNRLALKHKK